MFRVRVRVRVRVKVGVWVLGTELMLTPVGEMSLFRCVLRRSVGQLFSESPLAPLSSLKKALPEGG